MSIHSRRTRTPQLADSRGSQVDADHARPPRAILIDLNDTLFDHTHSSRVGLLAVCAAHPALGACSFADVLADHATIFEELHLAVLWGAVSIEAARTERFRRLLAHYGADGDAAEAAACYRVAYQAARQPLPDALALLAWLRGRDAVAIVSNNLQAEQEEKHQILGMAHLHRRPGGCAGGPPSPL